MKKHIINVCIVLIIQLIFVSCERDKNIDPYNFKGLDPNVIIEPDYFKDCQLLEDNNISNAYDFPIRPGDEEWKQLPSKKARLEACQIPDSILRKMCTYDLVKTYFNYPFLGDFFAFQYVKSALAKTRIEFNGFDELINRDNGAIKIVEKYENMDFGGIDSTWTEYEKFNHEVMFCYVEFTLSYDPILSKLNNIEKNELLKIAVNKYESKMMSSYFNELLDATIYLISNLLYDLKYSPFIEFLDQNPGLLPFIDGWWSNFGSDRNMIINHAKNYLSN